MLFCIVLHCPLQAQSIQDSLRSIMGEAIRLMDDGQVDASIVLLDSAFRLDPKSYAIPYEKALALYKKKNYSEAIEIYEQLKNHVDADPQLYQMLGNGYSMAGDASKAVDTYDEGLGRFPNAGGLYLEKGNIHLSKKEYAAAIENYERGIEVQPTHSSNYYRAATVFCATTEEVWGMLYGEIFMNIERNSQRTKEMSKLLFKTYASEIRVSSDSKTSVSFCKDISVKVLKKNGKDEIVMPFCLVYEPTLAVAVAMVDSVTIHTLPGIRSRFLDLYFSNGHNVTHPNVLFEYQKRIRNAGHFDAYNYWLLSMGDEAAFKEWVKRNPTAWDGFVEWFSENSLELDNENKFYRGQY